VTKSTTRTVSWQRLAHHIGVPPWFRWAVAAVTSAVAIFLRSRRAGVLTPRHGVTFNRTARLLPAASPVVCLVMSQGKYGAVIGREMHFFAVPCNYVQAMDFFNQSQRRIYPGT
jgi:hypothetical protein